MAEQNFEMLWDCPQCDAKDLLSKTHRHCPACGAAQDPSRRHFPQPGQEVEVQGHRYVGVDWRCSYCEAPNSAAAAFCINCGGPKDGTAPVKLVQDASAPPVVAPVVAPAPKPGRPWFKIVLGLMLVMGAVLAGLFFSKHDESVQLAQKTWSRQVDVERFSAVQEANWCDALPSDAYQVSRRREQRSTRQVADGQNCVDVRADVGDGTFTKRRECTARYRSEPVFDDRCNYRVNRWRTARTERLAGDALLVPAWPAPSLAPAPANSLLGSSSLGGERLGGRRETYNVQLQSPNGRTWQCDLSEANWQALRQGQSVAAKVRGTGGLDCDTLSASAN